jgi:phosphatidylinositol phospholipase C, delta
MFLRILLKSDDSFASNLVFAVAAVRILYIASGCSFIRMLDRKWGDNVLIADRI